MILYYFTSLVKIVFKGHNYAFVFQVLMFPERSYGKISVSRDGTLTISGVRKEDDGYYICSVISGIGSSMAKAYLEVTGMMFNFYYSSC